MAGARQILEEYVSGGKLMQLATLTPAGTPVLCNVWYVASFMPDRLWWISRHDREHSANVRRNPEVAGSIVAIPLDGLGQVARGVTFTGTASELPTTAVDDQVRRFVDRWPAASDAIDPARLASGDTPVRLYEVAVTGWVLFDELHFSEQPRQLISSAPGAAGL